MNSDDALERLKKRKRPTVPSRDASLDSSLDVSKSSNPEPEQSKTQKSKKSSVQAPESDPLEFTTKQMTLRLEDTIAQQLKALCQEQGISREVLIEALILQCDKDSALMNKVVKAAKIRHKQRLLLANHRRAQSMMQKFGKG